MRDVALEAHPLHQRRHAVGREALHQRVLERQVEARRARVALAAGAAAQLVVDAACVVALGADDVQAARGDDPLVLRVAVAPWPWRAPPRTPPGAPRPG